MANILYDDGRIGIAAVVLIKFCDALVDVLADVFPSDADKASELEARIARARVDGSTATSLDEVAAVLAGLITATRDVARLAARPDAAAAAWIAAARGMALSQSSATASPATVIASRLANGVAACAEAACLGEYAVALSQGLFTDRASALDAKSEIAAAAAEALERIAGACGREIWEAVSASIQYASDHLVARSLDLRPIVIVSTPLPMPATLLAWALYGDPQRADELVDRNRAATPAFMPTRFEALAP